MNPSTAPRSPLGYEPFGGTTGPTIFSCPTNSVGAWALIYGEAGNRLFTDETLRNVAIKRLLNWVKTSGRDSLREEEARITITMKDGTRYSRHVSLSKGDPRNPLTFEEIVKKFKDLTAGVISRKRANQIVETVRNLDKLEMTSSLVKLCRIHEGSEQYKRGVKT